VKRGRGKIDDQYAVISNRFRVSGFGFQIKSYDEQIEDLRSAIGIKKLGNPKMERIEKN